jgi:2-methylcitrate dehydratase PrpD
VKPAASSHRTATSQFVGCVMAIRYEDLPAEAVRMAKHVMLDGLGVAIAGADEPSGVGRIAKRYVRETAAGSDATVVTGGFKASVAEAAFANGTMMHALDFDNIWYPLNHPTSPTLPAILAIAEKGGHSGRKVIEAIVTAFEVQGRIRLAATGWETGRGFHKPGVTGTMGATAGVGKLLGLSGQQMLMAFGIAGSRAGSLSINTGTMTKSSHAGHGARAGVECATLASMGFTASPDIFSEGGFFDALIGGENHPELLTEGFGAPYRMVSPGVGFKKYPSSITTQHAIDAALCVRLANDFSPQAISSVEVVFPCSDHVDRPSPASGLDGKFSVQYTVAAALLDGEVTVASFTDARRFAPDMEALLPRIHMAYDASIPIDTNKMHVVVRVTLSDGRGFSHETRKLAGWVGNPLSDEQRLKKFDGCVRDFLNQADAASLVELVEKVDELDDVSGIMAIVGGRGYEKNVG